MVPRARAVAGQNLQVHIWVDHLGFHIIWGGAQYGIMASYRTIVLNSILFFFGVHVMECIFQILIFAFSVTIPYNKMR